MDNIIRNIHYSPPIHIAQCLLSLYVHLTHPPAIFSATASPSIYPARIHVLSFSFVFFFMSAFFFFHCGAHNPQQARSHRVSDAPTFVTFKMRTYTHGRAVPVANVFDENSRRWPSHVYRLSRPPTDTDARLRVHA